VTRPGTAHNRPPIKRSALSVALVTSRDQWQLVGVISLLFAGMILSDFGVGLTWTQRLGVLLLIIGGAGQALLINRLRRDKQADAGSRPG